MEKAYFALKHYFFEKIELDFSNIQGADSLNLDFVPSGEYIQKEGVFLMSFLFTAKKKTEDNPVVSIVCKSEFKFKSPVAFEEIPEYFFSNTIAILFPYIRAFVSTLTIQANVSPIILPTMNLVSLAPQLRNNVSVK